MPGLLDGYTLQLGLVNRASQERYRAVRARLGPGTTGFVLSMGPAEAD